MSIKLPVLIEGPATRGRRSAVSVPHERWSKANGLKASRYNILFESDGCAHLYNSRKGSYVRFPGVTAARLERLATAGAITVTSENEPQLLDVAGTDATLLKTLVDGEFLIPEDLDELELLKAVNRMSRFNNDSLSLTILTTLGCNLDCVYCYEDKNPGVMREEVQEKIIEFVSRQMATVRHMGVTWFGGEPLLGMHVLEKLSAAFLSLAAKHGAGYGADIITNGYLLTPGIAERLVALGVNSAQVTLDGTRAYHDARRPRLLGKPSFDVIFKNVVSACEIIGITVRMNLDNENACHAQSLIDLLAHSKLQGKVSLSFAAVHAEGKGCRDRNDGCKTSLFKLADFARLQSDLHKYAYEKGFPFNDVPLSKGHACCADRAQSYVIEPDGTLQKCWQTVSDPVERIGDVYSGTPMGANLLKWLNYDPFALAKCRSCKVLPLCMGWCPHKIMADPSPESCNTLKHTIVEDMKLYHKSMQDQRSVQLQAYDSDDRRTPILAG